MTAVPQADVRAVLDLLREVEEPVRCLPTGLAALEALTRFAAASEDGLTFIECRGVFEWVGVLFDHAAAVEKMFDAAFDPARREP